MPKEKPSAEKMITIARLIKEKFWKNKLIQKQSIYFPSDLLEKRKILVDKILYCSSPKSYEELEDEFFSEVETKLEKEVRIKFKKQKEEEEKKNIGKKVKIRDKVKEGLSQTYHKSLTIFYSVISNHFEKKKNKLFEKFTYLESNKELVIKQRINDIEQRKLFEIDKINEKYDNKVRNEIDKNLSTEKRNAFSSSTSLNNDVKSDESKLSSKRRDLENKTNTISSLESKLNSLNSNRGHTYSKSDYMSLVGRRNSLQSSIKKARSGATSWMPKSQYTSVMNEIESLNSKINRAKRAREIEQSIVSTRARLNSEISNKAELENQISRLKNELEQLRRRYEEQYDRDSAFWRENSGDIEIKVIENAQNKYSEERLSKIAQTTIDHENKKLLVPEQLEDEIKDLKESHEKACNSFTKYSEKLNKHKIKLKNPQSINNKESKPNKILDSLSTKLKNTREKAKQLMPKSTKIFNKDKKEDSKETETKSEPVPKTKSQKKDKTKKLEPKIEDTIDTSQKESSGIDYYSNELIGYSELFEEDISHWVKGKMKDWLFQDLLKRKVKWNHDLLFFKGKEMKYKLIASKDSNGNVEIRTFTKKRNFSKHGYHKHKHHHRH